MTYYIHFMGINPTYLPKYFRGDVMLPPLLYPRQTTPPPPPTYVPEGPAQVELCGVRKKYIHRELHTGMENGVRIKIQTPTHWNLIGRSMTAPPPKLSPSSILPSTFAQFRPQSDNAKIRSIARISFLHLFTI